MKSRGMKDLSVMQVGKGRIMKLEFFKFPHVTERIVGSKDDSSKAETRGESRRTLGATVVGILHRCTIDGG